jgi:antirestriction protein
MDMERPTSRPNGGEHHPETRWVNSYGTDDAETQAHIENARVDASRERERNREKLEHMVELGVNPDDAETVIEFEQSAEDTQPDIVSDTNDGTAEVEPRQHPRVYIACLASRARGITHGMWIDANQTPDELNADIAAMLDSSPVPGPQYWAIEDTEDFSGLELPEMAYTSHISRLGRGVAEHGVAFTAWVELVGDDEPDKLDTFDDFFVGSFDSPEDWAKAAAQDLEWPEQLDREVSDPMLRRYVTIDYKKMAKETSDTWDLVTGSDGRTYVFMR